MAGTPNTNAILEAAVAQSLTVRSIAQAMFDTPPPQPSPPEAQNVVLGNDALTNKAVRLVNRAGEPPKLKLGSGNRGGRAVKARQEVHNRQIVDICNRQI